MTFVTVSSQPIKLKLMIWSPSAGMSLPRTVPRTVKALTNDQIVVIGYIFKYVVEHLQDHNCPCSTVADMLRRRIAREEAHGYTSDKTCASGSFCLYNS